MYKVLFVCLGNICRSPTAEVIARSKARLFIKQGLLFFASAGTANYHCGRGSDKRSCVVARAAGYSLEKHRARCIDINDFDDFDLILVMDKDNMQQLREICPLQHQAKLLYFLSYHPQKITNINVPDPYYGDKSDFIKTLKLIEITIDALLNSLGYA